MRNSTYLLVAFLAYSLQSFAQTFTTNTTPVGMEHNILFNATSNYSVTQTGTANLNLSFLFDGRFAPSYTSVGPTIASPTVVLIEDLPSLHVQAGAWVGWSTRYWQAINFKIEGYNTNSGANEWVTMADYSTINYTGGNKFSVKVPSSRVYTKLRFTFYNAGGTNGRLGVSELFYIHPEATTPYANLGLGAWSKKVNVVSTLSNVGIGTTNPTSMLHVNGDVRSERGFVVTGNSRFTEKGDNLHIWSIADMEFGTGGATSKMILDTNGNLGIGTTEPKNKLSVNGTIWATKVKIQLTDAADWVFEEGYNLRPLSEVATFIKANKHLPEIPSAEEFRANDMEVSEMTNKLLQKIEELTLYTIEQEGRLKKMEVLENKFEEQALKNSELIERLVKLEKFFEK